VESSKAEQSMHLGASWMPHRRNKWHLTSSHTPNVMGPR
jgi:hypothetical protein